MEKYIFYFLTFSHCLLFFFFFSCVCVCVCSMWSSLSCRGPVVALTERKKCLNSRVKTCKSLFFPPLHFVLGAVVALVFSLPVYRNQTLNSQP